MRKKKIIEINICGPPWSSVVKNPPAMQEPGVRSLCQEDPWRRAWQPTPVFLPGESHEQKSLAGYSPLRHKQLDMTEATGYTCKWKNLGGYL